MIDRAKRLRDLILGALLVCAAGLLLISIATFAWHLWLDEPLAEAGQQAGASSVSFAWFLAILAANWACLFLQPPSKRSTVLLAISCWVTSVIAAAGIVFWLIGLFDSGGIGAILSGIGGFIDVFIKSGCAALLWRLRVSTRRLDPADESKDESPAPSAPPVWSPDEAVGLQWGTASQAAQGKPGEASPSHTSFDIFEGPGSAIQLPARYTAGGSRDRKDGETP